MINIYSEIKKNQNKRLENGKVVTYRDGEEYLVSPGYPPVSLTVFNAYIKQFK